LRPEHERIGAEGVERLRSRYAEVVAGLYRRVQDPRRRDELKTLAGRLNPDAWTTDEEVRSGLEEYESVFQSLREVVGRRRRRRRGGPDDEQQGEAGTASGPEEPDGTADPASERPADESGGEKDPSSRD
jgi:hypothetical protein